MASSMDHTRQTQLFNLPVVVPLEAEDQQARLAFCSIHNKPWSVVRCFDRCIPMFLKQTVQSIAGLLFNQ
jgi:hypothetical protein